MLPRFKPDVFDEDFKLVEAVEKLAKRKGVMTAQVAIGWVCRQGVIPISSSIKMDRVIENRKLVSLTDDDMVELQRFSTPRLFLESTMAVRRRSCSMHRSSASIPFPGGVVVRLLGNP